MSFPTPSLDDRTFQDLVDEAKRLIPRYCPEWTNHNVADPGIALIELFAWMTELTLYRLNRVPEHLYASFLSLLDIAPFGPSPASTDITFWLAGATSTSVVIPAGTEVMTEPTGGVEPVVFSTDRSLVLEQPLLSACLVGREDAFVDRLDDLRFGEEVACFTSGPPSIDDVLMVATENDMSGNILEVRVSARTEGIGVDPANPPIQWEAWDGERWAPCEVISDSTGGLNRDGALEVVVPPGQTSTTLSGTTGHWLRVRLVAAADGQPTYSISPRISSLAITSLGGSVRATHGQVVTAESLGVSDGIPGQRFVTRLSPVLPRVPGETVTVTFEGGADEWDEVAAFAGSTADDRHFVWEPVSGEIRFGPSIRNAEGVTHQHGMVPPKGSEVSVRSYRHGGGSIGNVGARTLVGLRTTIPYIDRVENRAAATGGVDPESLDEAKLRAPSTLRTGDRAVTSSDYVRLAIDADRRVARARCLPPESPTAPVRLLIVPRAPQPPGTTRLDDYALDDGLYDSVAHHLEPRRMLGTSIEIGTPFFQGVSVAVLARAAAGRPSEVVADRIRRVIDRFLDPLVGGVQERGWPFDSDLTSSAVLGVLESVDGVEGIDEVYLFEADLRTERRVGVARERLRLAENSLFLSFAHQVVVR